MAVVREPQRTACCLGLVSGCVEDGLRDLQGIVCTAELREEAPVLVQGDAGMIDLQTKAVLGEEFHSLLLRDPLLELLSAPIQHYATFSRHSENQSFLLLCLSPNQDSIIICQNKKET